MFGTLVSTAFDRGTLEYVGNPDPVAAVSRNLRDKIHISCISCRSRKVRCSGGRKRCQRCVTMDLECVYPENQGRNKRSEINRSRRSTIQRKSNVSTQIACDEAEPRARSVQTNYSEEFGFDDLYDIRFDDSCIDEALFTPWTMDTPMHDSPNSGSSSNSSDTPASAVDVATSESSFSAQSRIAKVASSNQLTKPSISDTSLASIRAPPATDCAGDLEFGDAPQTAHSDMSWAINANGNGPAASTSTEHHTSLDPRCKAQQSESSSYCCLLGSISFLERLVSRSASCENRIDLLLTEIRNSLETLGTFLACERCTTRTEQNMLLAMAARQIGVVCGRSAECYKAMDLRSNNHSSSSLGGHSNNKNKSTNSSSSSLTSSSSSRQRQPPDLNGSAPATVGHPVVDIYVSSYRVNQRERLHLLKSLVTLQFVEFQQHINTIKARCHGRSSQGQAAALVEAESQVKSAQAAIGSLS